MIPKTISDLISWLRFPLMLGVVLIHSGISGPDNYKVLSYIVKFFTLKLPAFCVPMFMIIAGYLFFVKVIKFTPPEYFNKLKSRSKSLVVPYLFWNSVVILTFWLIHRFIPNLMNPSFENIANFDFLKLINCYWSGSGGQPIAFQFWFIRDLIVFVILSPVFYFLFRKTWIGIALFTVVYLFDLSPWLWSAYFFALGAWLGIQKIDFIAFSRNIGKYTLILSVMSLVIMMIGDFSGIRQIYILSSIITIAAYGSKLMERVYIPEFLSNSSFFLFCVHALPLLIIEKISTTILVGKPEWLWIIDYFFNPLMIIICSTIIYILFKKSMPKFTSFITGGR